MKKKPPQIKKYKVGYNTTFMEPYYGYEVEVHRYKGGRMDILLDGYLHTHCEGRGYHKFLIPINES